MGIGHGCHEDFQPYDIILHLTEGGEQLLSRYSPPLPSGAVKPPISEPSATDLAWIKNPLNLRLDTGSFTWSTTGKKQQLDHV